MTLLIKYAMNKKQEKVFPASYINALTVQILS